MKRIATLALLTLTACGGMITVPAPNQCQFDKTSNGTSLLVASESAGINCTYGGVKIQNGTCAPMFACNGATGAVGATGDVGPQGLQGTDGMVGPQGPKGDTGQQGAVGLQGIQGIAGLQGQQGIQGPKGDTGVTGAGCTVSQTSTSWQIVCGSSTATIPYCPFKVCHHETLHLLGYAWWGHGTTLCLHTQTDHDWHKGEGDDDGDCQEK